MLMAALCPAAASKTSSAIFPADVMVTVWDPPRESRPVTSTLAVVYGGGGMKKSLALTAVPVGVDTEIFPDPAPSGTLVARVVGVAELAVVTAAALKVTLSRAGVVAKFVPVIVTAVPAVAIGGLRPVIVGGPLTLVTVKGALLDADPVGVVTLMGPVEAATGTGATICVAVDDVTVVGVPLKLTTFWLGVALNPVPDMVTVAPTGPLCGENSMTDTVEDA